MEIKENTLEDYFNEIKNLMRGKFELDYKDSFSTVFGIILNSVLELKYNSEAKKLVINLYKEPTQEEILDLNELNFTKPFSSNLVHISIRNEENFQNLFSYYKVTPKEEKEKILVHKRNINNYKDLLNIGIEIFNTSKF